MSQPQGQPRQLLQGHFLPARTWEKETEQPVVPGLLQQQHLLPRCTWFLKRLCSTLHLRPSLFFFFFFFLLVPLSGRLLGEAGVSRGDPALAPCQRWLSGSLHPEQYCQHLDSWPAACLLVTTFLLPSTSPSPP